MIQDIFNGISDEKDITMEYNGVKNIRPTKFSSQFTYIPIYYFSFIYSRKYRGNVHVVNSTVYRYLTDDIKDYMISTIKQVLSVHGDIIATIPSDFTIVNYKDGYYKNTIGICLSKYSSCVENLIKYDKLDIIEL